MDLPELKSLAVKEIMTGFLNEIQHLKDSVDNLQKSVDNKTSIGRHEILVKNTATLNEKIKEVESKYDIEHLKPAFESTVFKDAIDDIRKSLNIRQKKIIEQKIIETVRNVKETIVDKGTTQVVNELKVELENLQKTVSGSQQMSYDTVNKLITERINKIKIILNNSSSGLATWGAIGGTLSDQTDLQNALDSKMDANASLDSLSDVEVVTPLDNEVLQYETSTGLWKNKPISFAFNISNSTGETVVHNLNKYPSVILQDSAGTVYEIDVEYDNINTVTLSWNIATTGILIFN